MAEEIDLSTDLSEWVRLSDTECHFISYVLTFFAASDEIVNKNLSSNFTTKVTAPKARCFYGFQIAVESIHSKAYSLLIDMYIKDPKEKLSYFIPLKQYHASNTKPTGLANGVTPPTPVLLALFLIDHNMVV